MRTRIWHSDWKPRWLIRCVSAALLSFMDKQDGFCEQDAPKEPAAAIYALWHMVLKTLSSATFFNFLT